MEREAGPGGGVAVFYVWLPGKRRDVQRQGKLGVSVFKTRRLAHFSGVGDGPVERGRLEMPALRGGERGLWEQSPWVGQDVWREWPQRRPGTGGRVRSREVRPWLFIFLLSQQRVWGRRSRAQRREDAVDSVLHERGW